MKNTIYISIIIHFLVFPVFSQNKKTLEIISEKMCQYAKNEIQSQGDYFTKLNTCITNLINIDIPVHYPKFSSKGQDFQMDFLSKIPIKCQELCPNIMLDLILSSDTLDFSKTSDLEGKCVSGDCANGFGKYVWPNGHYHEGYWKNNKKNGTGTTFYDDGGSGIYSGSGYIKGTFKNGLIHGFGEEVRENGYKYVGDWKGGIPFGKGKLTWPNGESYEGEWDENGKSGFGIYTYKDGSIHRGRYSNDKPNGPGEEISYGSLVTYKGSWLNGKKEGKFTIVLADTTISCFYKNGLPTD